jgi:hypothetical protein
MCMFPSTTRVYFSGHDLLVRYYETSTEIPIRLDTVVCLHSSVCRMTQPLEVACHHHARVGG